MLIAAPAEAQSGGLDTRLTMKARQTLQHDPGLAILPELRASPSATASPRSGARRANSEIARQAETLLRQVAGVSDVRNELHVQSPTDPMVASLKQNEGENGRAWIMTARPASLMSRPEDLAATSEKGISLLPPITPRQSAPAAAVEAPGDPAAAIARLRQSQPALHGVQAEVRDGVVWLRPVGARAEDVFELARLASTVAGVERASSCRIGKGRCPPPTCYNSCRASRSRAGLATFRIQGATSWPSRRFSPLPAAPGPIRSTEADQDRRGRRPRGRRRSHAHRPRDFPMPLVDQDLEASSGLPENAQKLKRCAWPITG